MPTVTDIIRMRQRRRTAYQDSPSSRLSRLALTFIVLLSVMLAAATISGVVVYRYLTSDLPSLVVLPNLLEPPDGLLLQPTRVYDRTGEHVLLELENVATFGRRYLYVPDRSSPLEGKTYFSKSLIDATLAAADPTFWVHPGYELSFSDSESTTVAQRLVRELLFWDRDPGLGRALQERLVAGQLVAQFGRAKVLEWYLNSANYGHLAYGADAAARLYYGKSAEDLTLAESAMLAAISQAPDLNPFDTPEEARQRQGDILDQLANLGWATPQEVAEAKQEPLGLRSIQGFGASSPVLQPSNPFAPFTNLVFDELAPHIPRARINRGGLKIVTTLDYDLQQQVECGMATQLARLQPQTSSNLQTDETSCQTARLLPTLILDQDEQPVEPVSNAVVVDPLSAQVLALAGMDEKAEPLQRLEPHPPGSLLAPYVYLAAFTRGFSPASLVWDVPANLLPSVPGVPNPDGEFHGPMRMRTALANDYLVPTLQILNQMGLDTVWNTTRQLGLPSVVATSETEYPSILLGGSAISLLEITHAYGVFSTQGVLIGYPSAQGSVSLSAGDPGAEAPRSLHPTTLLRVEDLTGAIWMQTSTPQSRPVVSSQLAYLITHILQDERARWPSLGHPNALEIGRPAGAKLGRTLDGKDAWTVGFTPRIAVGVWVGDQAGDDDGIQVSPLIAAGIWRAVLQYMGRDLPAEGWSAPPGISQATVCDPSGLLPTPECPTLVTEVFAPGSEPTHSDTLYRQFQINRETGFLATVFTPPALIEQRVYMVVPPEAAGWAEDAGLPIPPESYDLVSAPDPTAGAIRLTAPEIFSYVKGSVRITGDFPEQEVQSYSVQVGKGLNPQQWTLVSEYTVGGAVADSRPQAGERTLVVWDTTGLSGLYAVRLQVVGNDQRLSTAIIQVTVDNVPPTASILYPQSGQRFAYPQDDQITLQLNAEDNLNLDRLEVFIDNRLLTTLTQQPFAFPWEVIPGEHTLRVRAYDLAGNMTEHQVTFTVSR